MMGPTPTGDECGHCLTQLEKSGKLNLRTSRHRQLARHPIIT